MVFTLGIVLIAAVVAFVAWPLFSRAGESTPAVPAPDEMSAWERRKTAAYSAIKEAEFDYRMGKLSDADFDTLRERYAAKALEAISAMEQQKGKARAVPAQRSGRILFCPECGRKLPERAKFCSGCGRALSEIRNAVA